MALPGAGLRMAGRPPTTCGAKQIYSPGLLTCGQKPATELFLAVVKSGQATKESKGLQFELLPASHADIGIDAWRFGVRVG